MFSIFKQTSDTQDGVLKELTEDQLSEVAGGKWHHTKDHDHDHKHKHHHHHHHHMWKTTHPTTTTTTTGTTTTTSMGVTYPAKTHW